jgi:K+-transporting ATPase ATPase C chain
MLQHLRRAVLVSVVFLVLLGIAYPLAGTGLSQLLFKHQADGSFGPDGSTLIEQQWQGPQWFQGRPDGTVVTKGPGGVIVSGTEQLGPRSKALEEAVAKEAATLRREGVIPTNDLVTYSGSLVDPDISPSDAMSQVAAVAEARGLDPGVLRRLVRTETHPEQLGFLGAPYVNVLELNQALAKLQ